MNNIISQDFWCATLTKENPECKWQQLDEEVTHHLMIEQAVLGLNCKDRCMIEATARTADGTEKSCMICHLIPSSVPNCQLTLSFKQVSLRLAAGDGPVYLTGTHSQEVEGADEFSDEEGEDAPALINAEAEEEEEESSDGEEIDEDKMLEELAAAQANKLKTFMKKDKKGKLAPPGPQSKKVEAAVEAPKPAVEALKPAAKKAEEKKEEVVVKQDEEMEDEEEDSSEEEDDDEEEEAEGKVEGKAAVEEGDDDDDDDDENEVDSDDDDEEEDDDEEDDEESEEESDEEEEPAPVTKKRKTEAATPVPVKANGKPAATPKQSKKEKPQTPVAKPNLNELKKKLMASPSLPKKYEKFVNLMKNAHKVTDDKEIKCTWEFVQKNKK